MKDKNYSLAGEAINNNLEKLIERRKTNRIILKLQGYWSMITSYVLLCIIAYYLAPWKELIADLVNLFSGDVQLIVPGKLTFQVVATIVIAVIVIEIPSSIGGAIIASVCAGAPSKSHSSSLFNGPESILETLFMFVIIEELFARWLFLGVLAEMPNVAIPGNIWFYTMLLIGNGIWAMIHLYNYKDPGERQLIRALPQFISGLFFSYIYVKFGLFVTILTHFGSNAILFASSKNTLWDKRELRKLVLFLFFGGAVSTLVLLNTNVLQLMNQFILFDEGVMKTWTANDFFSLYITVYLLANFLFILMMYDATPSLDEGTPFFQKALKLMMYAMVFIGILMIINWGLSFFIKSLLVRSFVTIVLFLATRKQYSASNAMREFWTLLPLGMIAFTALMVLPFSSCLIFLAGSIFITQIAENLIGR